MADRPFDTSNPDSYSPHVVARQVPEFDERGKMRFTPVTIDVSMEGKTHPKQVLAILTREDDDPEAFDGWVVNFAGQEYEHGHKIPGNGDLAGDVTWVRKNVSTPRAKKDYVRVFQSVHKFSVAQSLATASLASEVAGLEFAISDSRYIRSQLMNWTALTPEELDLMLDRQLSMDQLLAGARDSAKRDAEARIHSALGFKDSKKRHNPSVSILKHRLAEPAMRDRKVRARKGEMNMANRGPWAESLLDRVEAELDAQATFLEQREVLSPGDVEEFYVISRDTLKPANLLSNWLCYQIELGGGQIADPEVLEVARRGLGFNRFTGSLLRVLSPLAELSVAKASANSDEYQAESSQDVRQLVALLKQQRRKIGGPFDPLIEALYHDAKILQGSLQKAHWGTVIEVTTRMQHRLLYRGTTSDPAPAVWYGHTPPGSNPIELAASYDQVPEPEDIPEDMDWLPRGPRG